MIAVYLTILKGGFMKAEDRYGNKSEFDDLIKPQKKEEEKKPTSADDMPQITDEDWQKPKTPEKKPTIEKIPEKTAPPSMKGPPSKESRQPQIVTEKRSRSHWNKIKDIFWILVLIASAITLIVINVKRFTRKDVPEQKPAFVFKKNEEKKPPLTREMLKSQSADVATFGLRITGTSTFEEKIKEGLKLIFVYDRKMFDELKKYIYVIREGEKTDFVVEEGVPKILLTRKTASLSSTWCAGAIAHQLFLAKNYYERKLAQKPPEIPPLGQQANLEVEANPSLVRVTDPMEVENLEKKADDYQIVLMIKAGAPTYEIKLIKNRKPGDYSLTHDGRY